MPKPSTPTPSDLSWQLFTGQRIPHDRIGELPRPPRWRPRRAEVLPGEERAWPQASDPSSGLRGAALERARTFHATPAIVEVVNAALYLRRPLLVTGRPGSGKSSLVDAIAYELRLGPALRWPVTSHSTLRDALYQYDAIGRLQDDPRDNPLPRSPEQKAESVGRFLTLGPLGTALLPTERPRALLIDEIDKSDIDLPNDLLNVFEEGEYEVPELRRLGEALPVRVMTSDPEQPHVTVHGGRVRCCEFPLIVMTSNGEREFPAPFLRRCLRLQMPNPTGDRPEDDNEKGWRLREIVKLHFPAQDLTAAEAVIQNFIDLALDQKHDLATDQLLNAVYFVLEPHAKPAEERSRVLAHLLQSLSGPRT
ncbi:MoxR-like ATPase [Burkholderiales bacterium JOSHI_001]|nr:MoxR-like ATPase [Burkholderiales bacterium JOSHI_001]